MTLRDIAAIVTALCALTSVGCTVWVVFRDARWRKSGLAAQLDTRVAAAEAVASRAVDAAARWHETSHGEVMKAQIDRNTHRISRCEEVLQHVATREDVAVLGGKIGRIESIAETAANGIDRIENMLMKKALGA